MATSTVMRQGLRIRFDNGNVDGKQKYKSKSFTNIRSEATDDNLLEVSNALNNLTKKEILQTFRDTNTLIEEQKGVKR